MFSLTSLWKKPNTIKIPVQNYSKEQFQKNMNGILLKKYCNDFYYKSNIDSDSNLKINKKNDSLIPFNNDNGNNGNNNDNGNNIIIIILASVTSICFYFYKFLKV